MSEELLLLLVEVWARLMYRLSSFICREAGGGDSRWVRGGILRFPQAPATYSFLPSAVVQHIQHLLAVLQYFTMFKSRDETDLVVLI